MSEHKNVAAALAAAQTELPIVISKDKMGQVGRAQRPYTTLENVLQEVRPLLPKYGLALTSRDAKSRWPIGLRD